MKAQAVSAETFGFYLSAMHAVLWVFSAMCGCTALVSLVVERRRRRAQA